MLEDVEQVLGRRASLKPGLLQEALDVLPEGEERSILDVSTGNRRLDLLEKTARVHDAINYTTRLRARTPPP
ncbi:MAG: hypothetical protein ACOC0J_01520, partial [Myxococcota bacterium]